MRAWKDAGSANGAKTGILYLDNKDTNRARMYALSLFGEGSTSKCRGAVHTWGCHAARQQATSTSFLHDACELICVLRSNFLPLMKEDCHISGLFCRPVFLHYLPFLLKEKKKKPRKKNAPHTIETKRIISDHRSNF